MRTVHGISKTLYVNVNQREGTVNGLKRTQKKAMIVVFAVAQSPQVFYESFMSPNISLMNSQWIPWMSKTLCVNFDQSAL